MPSSSVVDTNEVSMSRSSAVAMFAHRLFAALFALRSTKDLRTNDASMDDEDNDSNNEATSHIKDKDGNNDHHVHDDRIRRNRRGMIVVRLRARERAVLRSLILRWESLCDATISYVRCTRRGDRTLTRSRLEVCPAAASEIAASSKPYIISQTYVSVNIRLRLQRITSVAALCFFTNRPMFGQ